MEDEKLIHEVENLPVEIEEVKEIEKVVDKKEEPVYIMIEDFLNNYPNLNAAEKYHYTHNYKTEDLRTASDWEGITKLNK